LHLIIHILFIEKNRRPEDHHLHCSTVPRKITFIRSKHRTPLRGMQLCSPNVIALIVHLGSLDEDVEYDKCTCLEVDIAMGVRDTVFLDIDGTWFV
jgi:hypothetical protein